MSSVGVKAWHDKMVELVTRMMELKKQQARAPKKQSPSARQLLDQKLVITDQQKDQLKECGTLPMFLSDVKAQRGFAARDQFPGSSPQLRTFADDERCTNRPDQRGRSRR
jgi:hypothetical protein